MSADSNQASPPLYFNCHMCGECCSSWNIPVEAHKAERLLEKPWVQARLVETNRQLTRMTEETYRIPLTDENVCVFLAPDRKCMVESQEGLALKPHECQRFPFATVRLPDGSDWHETSAACKSISEKLLLAFQPIQPRPKPEPFAALPQAEDSTRSDKVTFAAVGLQETAVRLADSPVIAGDDLGADVPLEPVARFPERVPVSGLRKLSQAQYGVYQEGLRAIFTQPDVHPEAALFQAHQWLRTVMRHQDAQSVPGFQSKSKTLLWRFNSAMAGGVIVGFLRKPYRTLSWVNLLVGPIYSDPRIFGMPINLRQQRVIPWNPQLNTHLNAFLFNLLQRKRMISLGSSLRSQLAMACVACLLVQWYAQTLAWMQSNTEISEMDLATAIRLVERYYTGHQPRFLSWFSSRWRGEALALLLLGVD